MGIYYLGFTSKPYLSVVFVVVVFIYGVLLSPLLFLGPFFSCIPSSYYSSLSSSSSIIIIIIIIINIVIVKIKAG